MFKNQSNQKGAAKNQQSANHKLPKVTNVNIVPFRFPFTRGSSEKIVNKKRVSTEVSR